MEPFFIFCAALVLYCGYLTYTDLLRDKEKETAVATTARRAAECSARTIPARRCGSWDRVRLYAATGKFITLSREMA